MIDVPAELANILEVMHAMGEGASASELPQVCVCSANCCESTLCLTIEATDGKLPNS